jgi:hypothetical protein
MAHAFTHEQVEALAHALWEAAGCPEGHSMEYWVEAERRLAAGPAPAQDSGQWHPAAAAYREHEHETH